MAVPMLIPLLALGGATIALAASSAKKKPATGGPNGVSKTYLLDTSLPEPLRSQVLAALSTSKDPVQLEAFASAIGGSYPYAAAALRAKASNERALQGIPAPLVAPPMPATPTPAPAPPAVQPAPPPAPAAAPIADWQNQILLVPEPTRTQVIQAMMGMNDPNALEAFAKQLDAQYPTAAWALRVREAALRGTPYPAAPAPPPAAPAAPVVPKADVPPAHVPAPVPTAPPQPAAVVVVPPVPSPSAGPALPAAPPTPAPPVPVLPSLGTLDPGLPVEMQKAVAGALTTETDPAKLEGFASAIQAQYPVAAGLLMAKAQALRFAQLPHSVPVPPASPSLPVAPKPPASPAAPSGRAPFPASGTYAVASGESPWSITQKFTGNGSRWKELIAANPDKPTRADGAWTTLMPGEVVKLPPSWAANNVVSLAKPTALLGAATNAHA